MAGVPMNTITNACDNDLNDERLSNRATSFSFIASIIRGEIKRSPLQDLMWLLLVKLPFLFQL